MNKTPMQEVVEMRTRLDQNEFDTWILLNANSLISKEKEMVDSVYEKGYYGGRSRAYIPNYYEQHFANKTDNNIGAHPDMKDF